MSSKQKHANSKQRIQIQSYQTKYIIKITSTNILGFLENFH